MRRIFHVSYPKNIILFLGYEKNPIKKKLKEKNSKIYFDLVENATCLGLVLSWKIGASFRLFFFCLSIAHLLSQATLSNLEELNLAINNRALNELPRWMWNTKIWMKMTLLHYWNCLIIIYMPIQLAPVLVKAITHLMHKQYWFITYFFIALELFMMGALDCREQNHLWSLLFIRRKCFQLERLLKALLSTSSLVRSWIV